MLLIQKITFFQRVTVHKHHGSKQDVLELATLQYTAFYEKARNTSHNFKLKM